MNNRIRYNNLMLLKISSFISSMCPFAVFILLKYHKDYYQLFDLKLGFANFEISITPDIISKTIGGITLCKIFYLIYFENNQKCNIF